MKIQRQKEQSAKAKLDAAKKEKENAKRALKRERKTLQNLAQQNNYYSSSEADLVAKMTDMDRLCEMLSAIEYVSPLIVFQHTICYLIITVFTLR